MIDQTKEKILEESCRLYAIAYGGLADSDPKVISFFHTYRKKTEVIIIFSILRIVMKYAWYLTSLKYSQRNFDWKEEPQRTISTQKSCRRYSKRLKKFTTHNRFWMKVRRQFHHSWLSRVRMSYALKSSRSSVTQHVCLRVSIWHCRIEWKWTLKTKNCFDII